MSINTFARPIKLEAAQYSSDMQKGVTRAKLVSAIDTHGKLKDVVLKLNKPNAIAGGAHRIGTSSASELICAMIARKLDLNVQDYAIVNVTQDFAETTRKINHQIGNLFLNNIGEHFGSIYDESLMDWKPTFDNHSQEVIKQLEDILTFDVVIMNPDRRKGNPNLMYNANRLVPIDHSLAFINILSPQGDYNNLIIPKSYDIRDHCGVQHLMNKGCLYRRILDKWQQRINSHNLSEIRTMLPYSWQTNESEIDKIFRFLDDRHLNFIDISNRLMEVLS